jgi:hypothetical protein
MEARDSVSRAGDNCMARFMPDLELDRFKMKCGVTGAEWLPFAFDY